MTDEKNKLISLGPEVLADALIEAAHQSDFVHDKIEQLISTPQENIERFKKKLSGLKRSTRFISWKEIHEFSHKLEMILQDLKSGIEDPIIGLKLVSDFYKTDNSVFERCDDSSGHVSCIYRYQDSNAILLVCKKNHDVIGVTQINFILNLTYQGGTRAMIEGVRIKESQRGQGIESKMINKAIDLARKRQCCLIQLTTDKLRPEALEFYKKLGFHDTHHRLKLKLNEYSHK